MIDYGKAFSFFTEDEHWLEKLGIGVGVVLASFLAALLVVLIPSFILYAILPWPVAGNLAGYAVSFLTMLIPMGYGLRLLRNVQAGIEKPLPEWNDWGNDLIRGFKLSVVSIVWMLPLLIFAIPTWIGGALTNNYDDAASVFGGMLLLCGSCLSFLYGLFVAVMSPGYTIAFLRDEEISSGLRFREVIAWTRANPGPVVTVAALGLLVVVLAGFLGALVGVILICIGLLVTLPLAVLLPLFFHHHLYGQLARLYPLDPIIPVGGDPTPMASEAQPLTPRPEDKDFLPPAISDHDNDADADSPDYGDTPSSSDASDTP